MARGKVVEKFSGWASGATSALALAAVGWLTPAIAHLSPWPMLGALAGAVLGSVLVYKLIIAALIAAFARSRALRQFVLGRQFIEGVWVGGYRRGGAWHVTIEHIDQTGEEIAIVGREFDTLGRLHSKWRSTSAALDPGGRLLSYSYSCDLVQSGRFHPGVGIFDVEPTEHGRPVKLDGYSIDTDDGKADPNTEYKAGPLGTSDAQAMDVARQRIPGIVIPAIPGLGSS